MATSARFILGALVPAIAAGVGGCGIPGYYEGGSGASQDKHVYISSPDVPKTITVHDTRDRSVIWSTDIPIGQQLVLEFVDDQETDNKDRTSVMTWGFMEAGQNTGYTRSSMPVPRYRSIQQDVTPKERLKGPKPAARPSEVLPQPEAPGRPAPGMR